VTLRLRLVLGLAAVAVLLVAPLLLALRALTEARAVASTLGGEEVVAALLLGRSRDITNEVRDAERLLLLGADADRPEYARRMRRAVGKLAALSDSLAGHRLPRQVTALRSATARLDGAIALEVTEANAGRDAGADSISDARVGPALRDAERALADAEQAVSHRAEIQAAKVRETVGVARGQALVLLIAGAAGATAVSVWLTRSVSRPVRELASGMEAVASGRFDHALRLAPARRDEFGALAANFGR
jgi:HAMP domain-containing protein